MTMKKILAAAVAACAIGAIAPAESQAQYYSSYSQYSYSSSYGSPYNSYYGRGYSHSYPSYRYPSRDYHHVHGYNHPKYKNRRGKGKSHKPDISIGPRWDPHNGWVYY